MPSTRRFIGASATQAQVDTGTVGGTLEAGDILIGTIGAKVLSVAAPSTVPAEAAEAFAAAWQELDPASYPEFAEISCQSNGADVTFEALTPGKPFTLALSTTEAGGGAADAQTFVLVNTTPNLSPNSAGLAANWSGNTLPITGDTVVFDIDSPDCLWDLDALDGIVAAELRIPAKSVKIGLEDIDDAGYPQYRPLFLSMGATLVVVDSQSTLMNLDLLAADTSVLVKQTGASGQLHRKALCLKGGTASSDLSVLRGSVGVGMLAGEAATFPDLRIGFVDNVAGDADVYCGADVTLTSIVKNGGNLVTNSGATSVKNRAGVWTHLAGIVTTATTEGTGVTIWNAVEALTNPVAAQSGVLDFSRDPRDKIVTNPVEVYGNASVLDPNNVVNPAGTFVLDLNEDAHVENIKIGANRRLTFGAVA